MFHHDDRGGFTIAVRETVTRAIEKCAFELYSDALGATGGGAKRIVKRRLFEPWFGSVSHLATFETEPAPTRRHVP